MSKGEGMEDGGGEHKSGGRRVRLRVHTGDEKADSDDNNSIPESDWERKSRSGTNVSTPRHQRHRHRENSNYGLPAEPSATEIKLQETLSTLQADLQKEKSQVHSLTAVISSLNNEKETLHEKMKASSKIINELKDSVVMKELTAREEMNRSCDEIRRLLEVVRTHTYFYLF